MGRMTLYDTTFITSTDLPDQTFKTFQFIANNRSIYLDKSIQNALFRDKSQIAASGFNALFTHIIESGVIDHFSPIDISSVTTESIPLALSNTAIILDTAQFKENVILRMYPEFYNKCLINLSSIIRKDRAYGDIRITDTSELHRLFVKGFLCMSYQDSDGWLTPVMCKYIMQTYSMTLAMFIAGTNHLTTESEILNVAFFLALFMCQKLVSSHEDLGRPALMMLNTFLGSRNDIMNFLETHYEETHKGLTFFSTIELIKKYGPDRLKRLHAEDLFRATKSICSDHQHGMISFEYPPYWVYQLFMALSGMKMGLNNILKRHKLMDEGKKFIYNMLINKNIIQSIRQ